MRRLLSLLAISVLTGCPKEETATPPAPAPTSTPSGLPQPPSATIERIARARALPGVAADPANVRLDASDGMVLPDLGAWAAGLKEELAPAPERVTRLVVRIDRNGATSPEAPEPDVAWLGLLIPANRSGRGAPAIDLNERRVKLLHVDPAGRPLKTPSRDARIVIKVGARVLKDWSELTRLVRTWPNETPVIFDAHVHVPVAHVATALAIVLSRGLSLTLAAPEVSYAAGGLPTLEAATRKAIQDAAQGAPLDAKGFPRLGIRMRADARARWANVCTVLSAAMRCNVRRVTLSANAGELEIDLFARNAFPTGRARLLEEYDPRLKRGKVVEKPIIILEEEVEVTGPPSPSSPRFDKASVVDAYGVKTLTGYEARFSKAPLALEGGSAATEAAVKSALRWLKTQQRPDGRWSAGKGAEHLDPGVTALTLLAYGGHGQTHRYGPYKRVVNRGLRWSKRQVKTNGSTGFRPKRAALSLLSHAVVTECLAEYYAMSRDFTLRRQLQRAARFAALGYPPSVKLDPKQPEHVTVVAALLRALRAVRSAKLNVSAAAEAKLVAWLETAPPFAPALAERLARGADPSVLAKAVGALDPRRGDAWDSLGGTEARFYVNGSDWTLWNQKLVPGLLKQQRAARSGAWKATGEWFLEGSPVVVTALRVLTLETYYRIKRPKRKK